MDANTITQIVLTASVTLGIFFIRALSQNIKDLNKSVAKLLTHREHDSRSIQDLQERVRSLEIKFFQGGKS